VQRSTSIGDAICWPPLNRLHAIEWSMQGIWAQAASASITRCHSTNELRPHVSSKRACPLFNTSCRALQVQIAGDVGPALLQGTCLPSGQHQRAVRHKVFQDWQGCHSCERRLPKKLVKTYIVFETEATEYMQPRLNECNSPVKKCASRLQHTPAGTPHPNKCSIQLNTHTEYHSKRGVQLAIGTDGTTRTRQ
jgi:hypothetical protein